MKRVFSACKTKPEKKKSVEAAIDYSELSESILTNQIKVDLEKIQNYAKQASSYIKATPEEKSYSLFLVVKDYVDEVADCYAALHTKMNNKKRGRK